MRHIPAVDRERLVGELQRCLPDASLTIETINADYGSWEIAVEREGRRVNIAWGPLSGFGTTDVDHLRSDGNPFASHDWPMESAETAIEFVVCVLGGTLCKTP